MTLQANDIADLALLTQEGLIKKGAFLNMQTDLVDYVGVREIWQGRKKAFINGIDWRFDVQMDHNHSAKAVGMYETDGSAINDTMVKGKVEARHINAHYIYDLREPDFQLGGTAVVDFLMTKYSGMMVSWYEYLEETIWGSPSASDSKTPHGIPFYIQKGTTGQAGFYGLDPSGYTAGRCNLLSSTYARWKNYYADYDTVNGADLFSKMRAAAMSIKFRSMLSHKEPTLGSDTKNGIYANKATILAIEDELKGQNMNLGYDTDPTGGRGVFQGNKYVYAPKLDDDSSNPIYMIDWKWFSLGCMPGWENNLTKPYSVADMHLVKRVDLDATLEFVCTDLRRQAVFATV